MYTLYGSGDPFANYMVVVPRQCFCDLARMTIVHSFRHILSPGMLDAAVMVCDAQADCMGTSLRILTLQVQTACLVQSTLINVT